MAAREVSPVQFYKNKPWAVKGEPVKKDFTAEVSHSSMDHAIDETEDEVLRTVPKDGIEYEAMTKSTKPIEDVEAPVLNDDDDDVISLEKSENSDE